MNNSVANFEAFLSMIFQFEVFWVVHCQEIRNLDSNIIFLRFNITYKKVYIYTNTHMHTYENCVRVMKRFIK
jgi:hypothetical protein